MRDQFLKYWKPLTAVIFWGISFIATKLVLEELTPLQIIFCRLILASAFLGILALSAKKDFTVKLREHSGIFVLALVAVFHLWIQITGLKYTTASNTGWIIGTAPVFMALLGLIFFREKLDIFKTAGIFTAFCGLLLLFSKGDFSSIDFLSNKGDFLILGSSFTWGIYSMINKKISIGYSPLMTIFFLFLMMAVIISPFTISESAINAVMNLSFRGWTSIIFLGIFCSGVAYVLWAQSLKELESARTGAFLYFEPFVTVAAAWLLLNEKITLLIFISGLIITAGVVLVNINLKSLLRAGFKKSN